jgi:hypothetical protein
MLDGRLRASLSRILLRGLGYAYPGDRAHGRFGLRDTAASTRAHGCRCADDPVVDGLLNHFPKRLEGYEGLYRRVSFSAGIPETGGGRFRGSDAPAASDPAGVGGRLVVSLSIRKPGGVR